MSEKKEIRMPLREKRNAVPLPTEWKEYLRVPGDLDDMLFGDLDSKSCSER